MTDSRGTSLVISMRGLAIESLRDLEQVIRSRGLNARVLSRDLGCRWHETAVLAAATLSAIAGVIQVVHLYVSRQKDEGDSALAEQLMCGISPAQAGVSVKVEASSNLLAESGGPCEISISSHGSDNNTIIQVDLSAGGLELSTPPDKVISAHPISFAGAPAW